MAYIHPDMVLFIAAIIALMVFINLYRKFDGNTRGLVLTLFGISLFMIASFLNYLEETPLGFIMLTITDEAGWDFIIPIFGYAPGGLLVVYGFVDWLKMTLLLRAEVSQRELAEQELRQAFIDVERANNAKNQFMSTMSHELRTPLNAIIGFSEIMSDPKFIELSVDKYLEYSGIIQKSANHLMSTIDEIQTLAEAGAQQYVLNEEIFCIEDVINDCLYMMSLQAEKKAIKLTRKISSVNRINGDQRLIKQMIINLLSDAIKHSPEKGSVECSITVNKKGALTLSVSDEGAAFNIEQVGQDHNSIVYASETYTTGQRGTGLSLTLVQRFIKLHDGYMTVSPPDSQNTTVNITFPANRLRNSN